MRIKNQAGYILVASSKSFGDRFVVVKEDQSYLLENKMTKATILESYREVKDLMSPGNLCSDIESREDCKVRVWRIQITPL